MTTLPSSAPERRARRRPSAVAAFRATPYLYLLPAQVVYAAFMLYPLVQTANYSLYEWKGFGPATFVGAQNYLDLLADRAFHAAIWHALVLVFFYAIAPTAVGLVLASVLRR